jgi:hypothetical protein
LGIDRDGEQAGKQKKEKKPNKRVKLAEENMTLNRGSSLTGDN